MRKEENIVELLVPNNSKSIEEFNENSRNGLSGVDMSLKNELEMGINYNSKCQEKFEINVIEDNKDSESVSVSQQSSNVPKSSNRVTKFKHLFSAPVESHTTRNSEMLNVVMNKFAIKDPSPSCLKKTYTPHNRTIHRRVMSDKDFTKELIKIQQD
jgi:hypothetical protein